ncbi:MAG: ABC transporter permease [Sneathiellaceae bacterium]
MTLTVVLQLLAEALRNFAASKQRTVLALIGLVIGTSSVIAMMNVGKIVAVEALRSFEKMGTDIVTVGVGHASGRDAGPFGFADFEAFQDQVPLLTISAPIVQSGGTTRYRDVNLQGIVTGATWEFAEVAKVTVSDGRFISPFDGNRPFAVLGSNVYKRTLQPGGDGPPVPPPRPGDTILIGSLPFTVVGILDSYAQSPMIPVYIDGSIFIPAEATPRLGNFEGVTNIIGRMASTREREAVVHAIDSYFQGMQPPRSAQIQTAQQLIQQMEAQAQMFTLLLGAIGSISLIVGGIGVMNIMIVSVSERRHEIGLRMAIGARPLDIQMLFLVESMVLSFFGGIIGCVLGIGASYAFATSQGYGFIVSETAVLLGLVVSVIVGIFFGYYPALQASRLDPIEALRS